MSKIETVLFDLDGTLIDTAPDMAHALNQLRKQNNLPEIPLADIRPIVGKGARVLIQQTFDVDDDHPQYPDLFENLLKIYSSCLANSTQLFPDMHKVLEHLETSNIPWGIVTNRPERFTHQLLNKLDLHKRSGIVICGDTLPERKPHPAPILHACKLMAANPETTLYVGDSDVDVKSSKAAGAQSLVALYGYRMDHEDPYSWPADGYIEKPLDIIKWI
jgi:2-phosphoglycolate phosphatase